MLSVCVLVLFPTEKPINQHPVPCSPLCLKVQAFLVSLNASLGYQLQYRLHTCTWFDERIIPHRRFVLVSFLRSGIFS